MTIFCYFIMLDHILNHWPLIINRSVYQHPLFYTSINLNLKKYFKLKTDANWLVTGTDSRDISRSTVGKLDLTSFVMIGRVSGCHCLKFISKVSYNESRGFGGRRGEGKQLMRGGKRIKKLAGTFLHIQSGNSSSYFV